MKNKHIFYDTLVVTLSSLDNDSRILKTINSLEQYGYKIETLSLNTKKSLHFQNYNIKYTAKRYFGIPKIGIVFLWFKILKTLFSIDLKNHHIIHCNDLNALPIGVIIKKFLNKEVTIIYDAHEYEINDRPNESVLSIKIKYYIERFLIRYVDRVITVSDAIANEYVKLYGIEKPALVLNTPPYQEIKKRDIFREKLGIGKDWKIFLYQGGLSKGRGIEVLLETFKEIEENQQEDKICIVFMGYGPLAGEVKEAASQYKNIYYHEAVSPEILLEYTSSADYGILFYENNCLNHYYCSPNKMFEYMMAELPVVVSNLYEMKRLVEKEQIGVVAKENRSEGLRTAIKEIIQMDQNVLKEHIYKAKQRYNWQNQEKVLLEVYESIF